MKRALLVFSLILSVVCVGQSHQQAKQLLEKVKQNTLSYNTQTISFTQAIETPLPQGGHRKLEKSGTLYVKGDLYKIVMEGITILRAKEKMYTILHDDEEITVTPIEKDKEGAVLSPLALLSRFENGYSYKMAGKETVNGKSIQYIRLKPTASEEIKEIMIGVDTKTNQLYSFLQMGQNNVNTTFTITKYLVNTGLSDASFVFNVKDYPDFYIVE